MPKPIIIIVGRPNVGKSTLFNRMTRKRATIVKNEPGVTRDRIYLDGRWDDKSFVVVDTGGFFPKTDEEISEKIKKNAIFGIREADLVIHLLDGKEGLTTTDMELVKIIRRSNKDVLWVVNKIDSEKHIDRIIDFYSIGERIVPVSAEHAYGYEELMDMIAGMIKTYNHTEESSDIPKIAIVGRPNVGKSTMVNTLLGKERMLVSPVGGTTRDSVDSVCRYYERKYQLIDTAGIRKRPKISKEIERLSIVRAIRSIERADIVVLLMDATEGITEQDKRIAGLIHNAGKGMIILFNKWDLIDEKDRIYSGLMSEIDQDLWFAEYAHFLATSGLQKKRITKIFPLIDQIISERKKRIKTGELNRITTKFKKNLPTYKGKELKVLYMTQVDIEPPQFALFSNYPEAIKDRHIRYFEKIIRDEFSFKGTPIRIYIKKRKG